MPLLKRTVIMTFALSVVFLICTFAHVYVLCPFSSLVDDLDFKLLAWLMLAGIVSASFGSVGQFVLMARLNIEFLVTMMVTKTIALATYFEMTIFWV